MLDAGARQSVERIIDFAIAAMGDAMKDLAEDVEAAAQRNAPVGQAPEDKHPGLLRESIHVEKGHGITVYQVVAETDYAGVVEATQTPYLQSALQEIIPRMAPHVAKVVQERMDERLR